METKVFIVEKPLALKVTSDDVIKRTADASYYDSSVFGLKKGTVLIVTGDQKIFEMIMLKGLEESKDKEMILKKLKELNDSSSAGVGALFA